MQKISTVWTQGLKATDKENMEVLVKQNTILLDRLTEILYNMREDKRTTVLGDYDSPSWSHKQAHLNGQLDMIAKILDIIQVRERDDHPTK